MATLQDLLAHKGQSIVSVRPTDTVQHVANVMNDRNIGGVIVQEGETLSGIFTERDVLRRVVARGLDPATTAVSTVMTTPVLTCRPDMSVEDCAGLMTTKRIRHLPVAGGGALLGIVTIGDLMAHTVSEQQATIQHMNSYIYDMR
ncbi:MAG: CBS domain-containing protein [Gemmatimonadales bacterium]